MSPSRGAPRMKVAGERVGKVSHDVRHVLQKTGRVEVDAQQFWYLTHHDDDGDPGFEARQDRSGDEIGEESELQEGRQHEGAADHQRERGCRLHELGRISCPRHSRHRLGHQDRNGRRRRDAQGSRRADRGVDDQRNQRGVEARLERRARRWRHRPSSWESPPLPSSDQPRCRRATWSIGTSSFGERILRVRRVELEPGAGTRTRAVPRHTRPICSHSPAPVRGLAAPEHPDGAVPRSGGEAWLVWPYPVSEECSRQGSPRSSARQAVHRGAAIPSAASAATVQRATA